MPTPAADAGLAVDVGAILDASTPPPSGPITVRVIERSMPVTTATVVAIFETGRLSGVTDSQGIVTFDVDDAPVFDVHCIYPGTTIVTRAGETARNVTCDSTSATRETIGSRFQGRVTGFEKPTGTIPEAIVTVANGTYGTDQSRPLTTASTPTFEVFAGTADVFTLTAFGGAGFDYGTSVRRFVPAEGVTHVGFSEALRRPMFTDIQIDLRHAFTNNARVRVRPRQVFRHFLVNSSVALPDGRVLPLTATPSQRQEVDVALPDIPGGLLGLEVMLIGEDTFTARSIPAAPIVEVTDLLPFPDTTTYSEHTVSAVRPEGAQSHTVVLWYEHYAWQVDFVTTEEVELIETPVGLHERRPEAIVTIARASGRQSRRYQGR